MTERGEDSWSLHYKGLFLLGNLSEQSSVKGETGGEVAGWKWLLVSARSPKPGNNLCAHHLSVFPLSANSCNTH